ncbi:MAG: hypothetical protein WBN57_04650 [Gammaproteobacteria bacterium]
MGEQAAFYVYNGRKNRNVESPPMGCIKLPANASAGARSGNPVREVSAGKMKYLGE